MDDEWTQGWMCQMCEYIKRTEQMKECILSEWTVEKTWMNGAQINEIWKKEMNEQACGWTNKPWMKEV